MFGCILPNLFASIKGKCTYLWPVIMAPLDNMFSFLIIVVNSRSLSYSLRFRKMIHQTNVNIWAPAEIHPPESLIYSVLFCIHSSHSSCRCKNISYPTNLPQVSIVFIFVNEALSVILRSIHSAMNKTPGYLLKEIILVDDNSSNGESGISGY